jgi:hypothetical protein
MICTKQYEIQGKCSVYCQNFCNKREKPVFRKQYHAFFVSYGSYLGRDQRMTPPESPREVREVREAGLLQTIDQNREQGQWPPEMEFVDIILTKDAWLVVR